MRRADFERLFDEHAEALYAFLVYRTRDRSLAEDLVADTFERALRARGRFRRRRGSEKTWLYAIALNTLRDSLRRRDAERRALERVGAGSEDSVEPDRTAVDKVTVLGALEALSEEEREAIALRYGAGLTAPEIARATAEPLTTVEGRVYRALRKLRAELDE